MGRPVRLDAWLVKQGLAASRARARTLIEEGEVLVDGIVADKPSRQVRPDQVVNLKQPDFPWVGRGALKLLAALEGFASVDPSGTTCADLGSSTGGFTEVLLNQGAKRVYAIDVGTNQLAWRLRKNEQIVVMEGTNARHLESLPEPIDLIVGDLSFISLRLILPTVWRLLRPGGEAVLLVKPQFEAGASAIAAGGKVRHESDRLNAIERVRNAAIEEGFTVQGARDCAVPGARAGNVEHFLHLQRPQ